jgi:hypothetical protein
VRDLTSFAHSTLVFVASRCSRTRFACWMGFKRVGTPKSRLRKTGTWTASSSRTTDQMIRSRKIDRWKSVKKIVTTPGRSIVFSRSLDRPLRRSRRHRHAFLAARKSGPRTERRVGLGSGSEVEATLHARTLPLDFASSLAQRSDSDPLTGIGFTPPTARGRGTTCAHSRLAESKSESIRSRTRDFSRKEKCSIIRSKVFRRPRKPRREKVGDARE